MMSGSLGEQHESTLAEREERRRATLPGATNAMTMPDGSTMLIRHGSGGAVQVSRAQAKGLGFVRSAMSSCHGSGGAVQVSRLHSTM